MCCTRANAQEREDILMSDHLYHIKGKVYTLAQIEKIAFAVLESEEGEDNE
jgi:hypothetical protein